MLPGAAKDLEEMVKYLSRFYPSTALKQYDVVTDKIRLLATAPYMCEKYEGAGSLPGLRRMVVNNYLVFYLVSENDRTIMIYAIINSASNYTEYI